MLQCSLELEPSTAHIARIVAKQPKDRVFGDRSTRFVDFLLVDQHAARDNHRLGAFSSRGQSPLYEQLVETRFHPVITDLGPLTAKSCGGYA